MKSKWILKLLFILALTATSAAHSQTQVSQKYSVDADVNALASYGDTLIVGGNFGNVGVYTGGGALFTTTSDVPNLAFQKIIGNIKASTPDGAGGFYVYGDFKKEELNINTFFPPRIEHIRADFSWDTAFSLPVNALFGVNKLLYHNGLLYIGGSYMNTIDNQTVGDLSAIDVTTKQFVPWMPTITARYLGGISGIFIQQNTIYITGGFTDVGGQPRDNIAAIELYTGTVKPWNFGINFGSPQQYTDLAFYNGGVVVAGSFSNGGSPSNMQHGCAIADSVTGQSLQYVFKSNGLFGNQQNYLYFAAGVLSVAVRGDTLFAFSSCTFDTRVAAVNLAAGNQVLWTKYFNMIAGSNKLEVYGDGLYVVGRDFTDIYETNQTNADTSNIERKIRGAIKLNTVTGNLLPWHPDPVANAPVLTLSIWGDKVFIGGIFTQVKSVVRTNIVMIRESTQEVLPFSINLFGSTIRAFTVKDTTLYAAGDYYYINGVNNPRTVLAFGLTTGTQLPWTVPYLGAALGMAVNEQYVFLGGNLSEPSGGAGRTNLFAVDRQTGALASWAPNPNNGVTALHLHRGRLYVGGNFSLIGDSARNYLASIDTATMTTTTWNPAPNWTVNAISATGGNIWIGGLFYDLNGSPAYSFVGVDAQTGVATHKPLAAYPGPSPVNTIYAKGCYVFFGSSFRINNTDQCNDLFAYDFFDSTLIPASRFCHNIDDLGGTVKAITSVGTNLHFGGNFTKVNGKANAPNLERIIFPAGSFNDCNRHRTRQSGHWNDPTTWEAGTVPPTDATVRVTHTITVTQNAECSTLEVIPGGQLVVSTGVELKVRNK